MKRAGISLALVVMLLLGAAAPVQAQAEETGLAAEAESSQPDLMFPSHMMESSAILIVRQDSQMYQ